MRNAVILTPIMDSADAFNFFRSSRFCFTLIRPVPCVILLQGVASHLRSRRFGSGPMESLWRRLSY
jgi:uncharacterized membrane protein YeiB